MIYAFSLLLAKLALISLLITSAQSTVDLGNAFIEAEFNLTKNDCVQKCHDTRMVQETEKHCKNRDVLCKAKHDCSEKLICSCKVSFFCESSSALSSTVNSTALSESLDYSTDLEVFGSNPEVMALKKSIRKMAHGGNTSKETDFIGESCPLRCSAIPDDACTYGFACQSRHGCETGKCKCDLDYYCYFKAAANAEFDRRRAKSALQVINAGGQYALSFRAKDSSSCTRFCDTNPEVKKCKYGGGCRVHSGACNQTDCACSVAFECRINQDKQIIADYVEAPEDEDMMQASTNETETMEKIQNVVSTISSGGRTTIKFGTTQEKCISFCSNDMLKNGCKFGFKCQVSVSCKSKKCLCTLIMTCQRKKLATVPKLRPAEITGEASKNTITVSDSLKESEIKYQVDSEKSCEKGCEPARSGTCGEDFFGHFQCQTKTQCQNQYCICTLSAKCHFDKDDVGQEFGEIQVKYDEDYANGQVKGVVVHPKFKDETVVFDEVTQLNSSEADQAATDKDYTADEIMSEVNMTETPDTSTEQEISLQDNHDNPTKSSTENSDNDKEKSNLKASDDFRGAMKAERKFEKLTIKTKKFERKKSSSSAKAKRSSSKKKGLKSGHLVEDEFKFF